MEPLIIPVLRVVVPRRDPSSPRLVEVQGLTDYFLKHSARSGEWMLICARGLGLLIDFTVQIAPDLRRFNVAGSDRNVHRELVARFSDSLLHGTMGRHEGDISDPTGLLWFARSNAEAKKLVSSVSRFLVWSDGQDIGKRWKSAILSDAVPDDPFEAIRFAYDARIRKNVDFLSYLGETPKSPSYRNSEIFDVSSGSGAETYRFPEKYLVPMLSEGFVTGKSGEQEDTVPMLISGLLFFAGLRTCEPLNIWVNDVQFIDDKPIVFLHHPREAKVIAPDGSSHKRVKFLASYNRYPRNMLRKSGHAGWKGVLGDRNGAEVHWLPIPGVQEFMAAALREYLFRIRPAIMRARRLQGLPDHPYLFVGSGKMRSGTAGEVGAPYTKPAFRSAWNRALARLRKKYDDPALELAKILGTTPHGARHFYGGYLKGLGYDGETIQRCMHHFSPFSHLIYSRLTNSEVNDILKGEPRSAKGEHLSVSDALQRQIDKGRKGNPYAGV